MVPLDKNHYSRGHMGEYLMPVFIIYFEQPTNSLSNLNCYFYVSEVRFEPWFNSHPLESF